MNNYKIYAFLSFLLIGSNSPSAQSMLELYFGWDKDSLLNEVTKLIYLPKPTFNPTVQMTEPDTATIADMGFQPVFKSENRSFTLWDNNIIFAHRYFNRSVNTSHNGARQNAKSFTFINDWNSKL